MKKILHGHGMSTNFIKIFCRMQICLKQIGWEICTMEGVLLLLEANSRPVYVKTGRVNLFSARDFLYGPRYVKQLASIEIMIL